MKIEEKNFPKLKWPLETRHLTTEQRLILLAYDIVWRQEFQQNVTVNEMENLSHDICANLQGLGAYIEQNVNLFAFEPELKFEE